MVSSEPERTITMSQDEIRQIAEQARRESISEIVEKLPDE